MAHIQVPEGVPGIRSLVMFRPETGKPLYELAQVLLRGESPLSEAERELIAAYVSHLNELCFAGIAMQRQQDVYMGTKKIPWMMY